MREQAAAVISRIWLGLDAGSLLKSDGEATGGVVSLPRYTPAVSTKAAGRARTAARSMPLSLTAALGSVRTVPVLGLWSGFTR